MIITIYDVQKRPIAQSRDELIDDLRFSYELGTIPEVSIKLPIKYAKHVYGRQYVEIAHDDILFCGYVVKRSLDKVDEVLNLDITHEVGALEWSKVTINKNLKNLSLREILQDPDLTLEGYDVVFTDTTVDEKVDYELSATTKLQMLSTLCTLYKTVHWRVSLTTPRLIEIGSFGDKSNVLLSKNNLMIADPTIEEDYRYVVNLATFLTDKSQTGTTAVTLREGYEQLYEQDPMFPIVKNTGANTMRQYGYLPLPQFGGNLTTNEYSVMDIESIALESGMVYSSAYGYTDIQPTAQNSEQNAANDTQSKITNEDRIKASQMLYHRAIRKMISLRRTVEFVFPVEDLPTSVHIGDKVRWIYKNELWEQDGCSDYMQEILSKNDWFYLSAVEYNYSNQYGREVSITLTPWLTNDYENN